MRRPNPSMEELKRDVAGLGRPLADDSDALRHAVYTYYELNYKLGMMKTLPWHHGVAPKRRTNTIAIVGEMLDDCSRAIVDAVQEWFGRFKDGALCTENRVEEWLYAAKGSPSRALDLVRPQVLEFLRTGSHKMPREYDLDTSSYAGLLASVRHIEQVTNYVERTITGKDVFLVLKQRGHAMRMCGVTPGALRKFMEWFYEHYLRGRCSAFGAAEQEAEIARLEAPLQKTKNADYPWSVRASIALQVMHRSGPILEYAGVKRSFLDRLSALDPEAEGWNDDLREIGVQI